MRLISVVWAVVVAAGMDRIDGTVEGSDEGNIAGSEEVGIWEEGVSARCHPLMSSPA